MFEIKNVSKQYGQVFALNDVSMKIGKGLNFIVGASGSGKTTLLKIISGMEQKFEGEITYCGESIKSLSQSEKSYFYNHIFGFVWQDFNLLEDSTVLENVLLPQYLTNAQNKKAAGKILRDLEIYSIASKKVNSLSGGQKQRVAIARELMKNPQVIFADEPTSALDEKTAKTTMEILRVLSKSRMVIVVTHDTSLIEEKDTIYELDKGELVSRPEINGIQKNKLKLQGTHKLLLKNAFSLAKTNVKNRIGRFAISAITLVVASVLLLTTVSGTINNSSQGEFDKLLDTYGESLCDISITNSFIDAAGTDGGEKDGPSGDVTQDISGLYDQYAEDDRVSFLSYLQAFDNIKITADDTSYDIQSSGNVPYINKLIAGTMPKGNKKEVVVPESFVKTFGSSPEKAIGKEIQFKGSIYNWSSGEPVSKETEAMVTIVGVMDTTAKYEYEGKIQEYTVDDSFLFSKTALEEMTKQAETDINKQNFLIRAKTPADMIAIKDELSEDGIVPLGRFELVEDMVRLNNQTTEQSGAASMVIGVLSVVMVIVIFLITGYMRKKEAAIYKISGFTNAQLAKMNVAETIILAITASLLLLIGSPLFNLATKRLFEVNIMTGQSLVTGVLLILLLSVGAYLATVVTFARVQVDTALKAGDRS